MPLRALVIVVACGLMAARTASAQDAFEIQVYDAETAPRGHKGLEVHLNHVANGSTTASPDGELATDHVSHLTLEPHVGLRSYCELGGYFQTAMRADGNFDFAGAKLRAKFRLPRRLRGLVGLALNGELSAVPRQYERNVAGGELRPIIDIAWRRLYASLNPIVAFDFGGRDAGHPQLQPAATVLVKALDQWLVGVEYYGAYGPMDRFAPASEMVHRLFLVTTLVHGWFGFHVGAGYGLAAGDKWIVKSILSFDLAPR